MIQRLLLGSPANPGANSSVVLYDSANEAAGSEITKARFHAVALLDQDFTINSYWAADGTSGLRLMETYSYVNGVDGFIRAVRCAQPITVVAKASLVNNDYFTVVYTTVIDGLTTTTTKIFEYKVDGTFVATEGRTTVDVSGCSTATTVAVATATAIRTAFVATALQPALTVAVPSSATLTIKGQSGPRFAISATENVANGSFSIGTAVAGVEGTAIDYDLRLRPGRNKAVLVTATAPEEFDVAQEITDDVNAGWVE